MGTTHIAGRQATVLWEGEVAVVGASLTGIAAARAAALAGRRVCLLEPGPALGTELSAGWQNVFPASELMEQVRAATTAQGAPPDRPLDIVLGTLAFDEIAAKAGVTTLVKVLPARVLVDRRGRLSGLEVVGKSGRQSVLAPVVIDATPGQALARRALGLPDRERAFVERRLYVAGLELPAWGMLWEVPEALGLQGNRVEAVPAAWPGEALLRIRLPAAGRSPSELLAATLLAAGAAAAWLRQNVQGLAGMTVVDVAPALLEEFRDDGVLPQGPRAGTGLHVAPGRTFEPGELAGAERLGREAAHPSWPLPRQREPADTVIRTRELRAAPEWDLAPAWLPPAPAIVHEPCDVLVAGYGTGGAFAALAAAEAGVSVTVLDAAPIPGGIGSAGRIHSYYHGCRGGIQDRLDEAVAGRGSALAPRVGGYHPVGRAEVLAEALARPGIRVCSGHTVFGVVREGRRVTGVLSAAQDGYHLFPCHTAVDATGDGDLAAAAGAPMTLGRQGDGFPQPYSYTPSLMRNGHLSHHNFDAGWVDPTDTRDFSRAHFEGRRQIACRGPFTTEHHYCTLACILGLRESRFAAGPLTLTFDDFLEGRTFEDTVCSGCAHHDNHAMDYAEESEWSRRHVVFFGLWRFLCHGDVPYRALLTTGVDGILVGCRALSVDHDLHQLLRMQRDMQVIGEIAGAAAAEAVKRGLLPRQLPAAVLKPLLAARGIQPRPAQKVLDLPIPELLERLRADGHERGLAMWRLSRQAATVDWAGFLDREQDPGARFCGAVAAALGGVRVSPVLRELWDVFRRRVAEPPLGVKSPPRYVVALLALAELRAPGVARAIGEVLRPGIPAPEALLLLRALAVAGEPDGIEVVRAFLRDCAAEDFPTPLWGSDPAHTTPFRDVVFLRAARTLAALGAPDERPRVEALCSHPMLLMRRHARRVLAEIDRAAAPDRPRPA